MTALHTYLIDLKLDVSLRVEATSPKEAWDMLRKVFDAATINAGHWPDGSPVIAEATMNERPDFAECDDEPVPNGHLLAYALEHLSPIDLACAYLMDYRPPGAEILPSEKLELIKRLDAGQSPAAAAEAVQAKTT